RSAHICTVSARRGRSGLTVTGGLVGQLQDTPSRQDTHSTVSPLRETHALLQQNAKVSKVPEGTEKVTSLGKDWHRPCLKCEKCSKTLSAGSHAEHDGKPYCHKPCYSALFGPTGFGRGGTESHTYK
ncbi:hypothetical protein FQN60_008685, partial [Etheostoma spectabile]